LLGTVEVEALSKVGRRRRSSARGTGPRCASVAEPTLELEKAAEAATITHADPATVRPSLATEVLLREGLGRAPQAEEQRAPRLPATAAAVSAMVWPELQLLASTIVADEIGLQRGRSARAQRGGSARRRARS
jgi:hypothetical protein